MRSASEKLAARAGWVRAALLIVWFCASFGVAIFARDLDVVVAGWPLNFWLTAQGGVLVFLAVVMVYAWALNQLDPEPEGLPGAERGTQRDDEPAAEPTASALSDDAGAHG